MTNSAACELAIAHVRLDDTPSGCVMVFELRQQTDGCYFVRLYYLSQTLDQMHDASTLNSGNPPTAALFFAGASGKDAYFGAPLADFNTAVAHRVDPKFTNLWTAPSASEVAGAAHSG